MLDAVLPFYFAYPDRPPSRAALEELRATASLDLAAITHWESGGYQQADVRPLLPEVRCPTLVLAGAEDFIAGPAQARHLVQGIRRATYAVVAGCGHMIPLEAPDEFRELVLRWHIGLTRP